MESTLIIRHQLLAKRDELIAHYHDVIEIVDGELDHCELEAGASAAEHWQERVVSLLSEPDVLHELADVLAALSRIDAGTFGTCMACDIPIDVEELEANPVARTCVDCIVTGEIHTGEEHWA